ncbi:MAG TPA: protein translocase subunit SecD [Longimicrobiaceae bacterium]|nr:protein translocase subunit SecD [Longimicrobiaceae bacterium]
MFETLKARFIIILALVAVSVVMMARHGITLGLDLQGGTHLALEVSDPNHTLNAAQRADAIDRAQKIIRTRIDEIGVAEPVIQKVGRERILIDLPGANAAQQSRAKAIIQKTAFLEFKIVKPASDLQSVLPRLDRVVAEEFGTTTKTATGAPAAAPVAGGLFQKAGPDSSKADTARADTGTDSAGAAATTGDSASSKPFSSKLQPTGALGEFAVLNSDVPAMEKYLASPRVQEMLPRGEEFRWGIVPTNATPQQQQYQTLYLLDSHAMMTGEYLEDAQAQRDPQFGQPIVTFKLNRQGGRLFGRATGEHIGDNMAIVLDNKVYSAPVIQSQIEDNGQITMGGGTIEEARDLALVLRAGALPVPVKIVEERTVGPSLGSDSVQKGELACVIGVLFVVAIMVGYYRFAGVMAVVALIIYLVLTLGSMAFVNATLTMPGIAGIVLSVGMAVDANVLIFERIREELELGRSARVAVHEGFSNAMSSIVDSQVTTLLTALVLFEFGTGAIRGFAVTLSIGIIASMFTAIYVTRSFFLLYLDRRGSTARAVSI